MIIDTIGITYNSMEELIERQSYIEDKIEKYITEKEIANRYESVITVSQDNKYYLTVRIIAD